MTTRRSRKPLLVGYLCVTIVVVMIVGLASLYMVQGLYVQQTEEDLEARARLCSHPVAQLLQEGNVGAIDALCKNLGKEINTRITVIRPDGQVIGDTEESPKEMENHADRPEVRQVLGTPTEVGSSTRHSATLEETLMYVAVALPKGGPPTAIVRTSLPITTLDNRLDSAYRSIATAVVVGLLIVIATLPWFSIRLTRLASDAPRRRGHTSQEAGNASLADLTSTTGGEVHDHTDVTGTGR